MALSRASAGPGLALSKAMKNHPLFKGFLALSISFVFLSPALAQQSEPCPEGLQSFTQGLHQKLRTSCATCHGGQGPGPSHSVADPVARL